MGTSRFLKTVRARHDTGALVVKVFIKPDALLSLKWIARRINGTCSWRPPIKLSSRAPLLSRDPGATRMSECAAIPARDRDGASGLPDTAVGSKQPL